VIHPTVTETTMGIRTAYEEVTETTMGIRTAYEEVAYQIGQRLASVSEQIEVHILAAMLSGGDSFCPYRFELDPTTLQVGRRGASPHPLNG
jgi:hypothetical protein